MNASFRGQLQQARESVVHFRILLFLLVLILLYGFILWRANTLANADPDPNAVASQAKTTTQLHIDQAIVDKVKQLEDNSVNVQALFDQARQNPFRE